MTLLLLVTWVSLGVLGVAPFVWWGVVFMGGRILTIPTDADAIILATAEPDIIVEVDVDEP
jgi:hypothetical protein